VPISTPGLSVLDDDFMGNSTAALWGRRAGVGRGDLAIMRQLGANAVRLYGNDPLLNHSAFLDEAAAQGLEVIVGFSDYPYIQMKGNCMQTARNCYTQIRHQYALNLRNGFLSAPRTYHPALRTVVLMNEPDLKMETGFIQGAPGPPANFLMAQLSALDAVLDAEREAGVVGRLPNFTVAFSFAKCPLCSRFKNHPSLGQMWELRLAMQRPQLYGYVPRNNLWAAYQARFVNSFNTANSARDVRSLFLEAYDASFQGVPVFIGEYHSPFFFDQQVDLEEILELSTNTSSMLAGICFFEFQVRYDKGGGEMNFGMFGLRFDQTIAVMDIADRKYSSWCLEPMRAKFTSQCANFEADIDYVTKESWALNISHISTAEMCCARCHEHSVCRSWTWQKDAGLEGVPSRCMLKGGVPQRKVRKDGCISGWPAIRRGLLEVPDVWVHTAVERAFGGPGLDRRLLCPPRVAAV